MTTVLLIIHLFVTLALIGVVLIQRSEGGGLGVGTSQGMGSFMSGRGTANLLTRTTAILATIFFALSLALALLNRGTTVGAGRSILDVPPPIGTPAQKPSAAMPPVLPPAPVPAASSTPTPAASSTPPPPQDTAPPPPESPAPASPAPRAPAPPPAPASAPNAQ